MARMTKSESDQARAEMERIGKFCRDYLEEIIPAFFEALSRQTGDRLQVDIEPCSASHVHAVRYSIALGSRRRLARVWVGMNLFHAYLVWYFDATKHSFEAIKAPFELVVAAAENREWKVDWEELTVEGEPIVALTFDRFMPFSETGTNLKQPAPQTFIEHPRQRVQLGTDVAELTRSIMQAAVESGVYPRTRVDPDLGEGQQEVA